MIRSGSHISYYAFTVMPFVTLVLRQTRLHESYKENKARPDRPQGWIKLAWSVNVWALTWGQSITIISQKFPCRINHFLVDLSRPALPFDRKSDLTTRYLREATVDIAEFRIAGTIYSNGRYCGE